MSTKKNTGKKETGKDRENDAIRDDAGKGGYNESTNSYQDELSGGSRTPGQSGNTGISGQLEEADEDMQGEPDTHYKEEYRNRESGNRGYSERPQRSHYRESDDSSRSGRSRNQENYGSYNREYRGETEERGRSGYRGYPEGERWDGRSQYPHHRGGTENYEQRESFTGRQERYYDDRRGRDEREHHSRPRMSRPQEREWKDFDAYGTYDNGPGDSRNSYRESPRDRYYEGPSSHPYERDNRNEQQFNERRYSGYREERYPQDSDYGSYPRYDRDRDRRREGDYDDYDRRQGYGRMRTGYTSENPRETWNLGNYGQREEHRDPRRRDEPRDRDRYSSANDW
jgi:hypothetical protein